VPTSLIGTWVREAARFTPDLRVLVLHGSQRSERFSEIPDCDLVLTTYPLLLRDATLLAAENFSFLILDEAQNVKNPDTQAARLLRRIECRHRLCLTGTPLENHLGELWAQFDFLMPGFLGDQATFNQHYRTPIEKHGDQRRRDELTRRIRPFLLRRGKGQVMEDLPPKTEILKTVRFSAEQAQLYESVRVAVDERVRQAISERGLARSQITILDALLKLRQICCDPRLLKIAGDHRRIQSAKLELLMDLLPGLVAEGRRILLFSQFTEMLGLIEHCLHESAIPYVKLTGETRDRDAVIDQFRSGEMPLFLISLKAGGVGLSLVEADTVILYDPWWNPAIETQAADRAYRIGQDRPVFVYKLVVENSVESRILELQERKRRLVEDVLGEAQGEVAWRLDNESLQALLAPL
jgi:SNF2 family DNA or RNA helicase